MLAVKGHQRVCNSLVHGVFPGGSGQASAATFTWHLPCIQYKICFAAFRVRAREGLTISLRGLASWSANSV